MSGRGSKVKRWLLRMRERLGKDGELKHGSMVIISYSNVPCSNGNGAVRLQRSFFVSSFAGQGPEKALKALQRAQALDAG